MKYPFDDDTVIKKTYKGSQDMTPGKLYKLVGAPNNNLWALDLGKIYLCVKISNSYIFDRFSNDSFIIDNFGIAIKVTNPMYIFEGVDND